jgi:hypothetical protein
MRRVVGLALALLVVLLVGAAAVSAAEPAAPGSDRVLISVNGDVTLPAGEEANTVLVVKGHAEILGTVHSLVVIEGSATLTGAHVDTVTAVRSPVTLNPDTVVSGNVNTFDSLVTRVGNATVGGDVRNIGVELAGLGVTLAPLFALWMFGLALVGIAFALLLAALGARQVRTAETLIVRRPLAIVGAGLLGLVLPILVAIPLFITVVGAPLGLVVLLVFWPVTAFLGYLVAGIAIGDWIVGRLSPGVTRERPYLAAVVGIVLLELLAIVPFVIPIVSFVGFGAVLLLAWETFRSGHRGAAASAPLTSAPAPTASAG